MGDVARPASRRQIRILCGLAFVASTALVALDLGFDSYGTIESNYFEATRRHIEWVRSLGEPGRFEADVLREHFDHDAFRSPHPAFSRWLSAASFEVFTRGLGVDPVVGFRLHNAFLYGLVAVGVAGYAARSWGLATGIAALLLLWGDVRLFGHAHPAMPGFTLTALWLWAVLLLLRAVETGRTGLALAAAVTAGLALATKLTGLQLVLLLAFWPLLARGVRGIPWTCALLLVPPLVFYVTNPQSWLAPIDWCADFYDKYQRRDEIAFIPTLFLGKVYGHEVPFFAPLVHALVTTPLPILGLGLVALAGGTGTLARADGEARVRWLRGPWPLLLAAGLSPIALMTLPTVPAHDLERLFVHAHPFLVLFAACGFRKLLDSRTFARMSGRLPGPATVTAPLLLGAFCCLPPLVQTARYHPYELVYFNALVGGPRGAEALGLDIAYLKTEANGELLQVLNTLPRGATLYANFLDWDLRAHQGAGTLRRDIRFARKPDVEFVVIQNRRGWMTVFERRLWDGDDEPVWRSSHDGVDLIRLYQLGDRGLTGGAR